jgi:curved DNA-binding protein CbpA
MNTLHDAYSVLNLKPGTGIESIRKRYKRLAMVWHPDRMPDNKEMRASAEDELQKINNAKDILEAHFKNEHAENDTCNCKPVVENPKPETNAETEPVNERARAREQEAERVYEEEKKREAAQAKAQAEWEAKVKADEAKRWNYSVLAGKAFAALFLLSCLVTSLKGCGGN